MALISALKRVFLPAGRIERTLPAGIGRGLRMGVDFHRGETRLFLGLYEMELNKHLRALVRPGISCFDIGGQYGYDALVLAKLSGRTVVSAECDPALAEEIAQNGAANPKLASIVVETVFVGAPGGDGVTIDELATRHFVPDFIKMDIEGGEVDALRGAEAVLGHRPSLLIEVHGTEIEWECLEILRHAGYEPPLVVQPRPFLKEHRPLAHNRWLVLRGSMTEGCDRL